MTSGATIRARSPCSCGARQWFRCVCDVDEVVYEASGHPWQVEDLPIPTDAFVAYVRSQHPADWNLIYIH